MCIFEYKLIFYYLNVYKVCLRLTNVFQMLLSGSDIRLEYQKHLRIREAEFDSKQRIESLSTRLNLDVERLTMLIREKKRIDQSERRIIE
jgi:hypothetical protein